MQPPKTSYRKYPKYIKETSRSGRLASCLDVISKRLRLTCSTCRSRQRGRWPSYVAHRCGQDAADIKPPRLLVCAKYLFFEGFWVEADDIFLTGLRIDVAHTSTIAKIGANGVLLLETEGHGTSCLPIKSNIHLSPPVRMTKYYFDLNLLRDLFVHLQLQRAESPQMLRNGASNVSVIKKPCFICRKQLPSSEMRCHIGTHFIKHH